MKRVLDDLNIFCSVVENGSLKRAAEQLAMPHSTVSRRIDALEASLGLTLLHRTTREVKVSERGQELYQNCSPLFGSLQRSIDIAVDAEIQFRGSLKVSMPVRAGLDFLGTWLIDFAAEHPDLKLDLSLSNSNKNLIQEDIDLAFRVGPLTDSSAIALKLWDIPYSICACATLLEQHNIKHANIDAEMLGELPCVVARPALSWAFLNSSHEEVHIQPNQQMLVDDLSLAYHAALSGKYVAMLPTVMLNDSELVTLQVAGLKPRTRIMYAYYMGRRYAHSQIKKVVEYIKIRHQQYIL